MFISRKHLKRRTFLRGLGATVALPLLDAMVPAFAATTTKNPRIGFVYVPHGMVMSRFTPDAAGKGFVFKDINRPLEPYRDRLSIVSRLHHRAADSTAVHSLSPTTWLSGVRPKPTQGVDAYAGVTADQIAASAIGQDTLLPSMEVATEDHSGLIGACDRDYGCIYMNTLSWRTPTTPMPMEINPRKVFERMFGQGDSEAARLVRRQEDRSILDAVTAQATGLQRELGAHDRQKLDDYLEGVREIERRLTRAESQVAANADLVIPEAPSGVPFEYTEHVRLMYDLLALSFSADITRVFTFMMGREASGRTFPTLDIAQPHHDVSHHGQQADKMSMHAKINTHFVSHFASFVETLSKAPEGDGTVLDNTLLVYGNGMSDGQAHNAYPLPLATVGGLGGTLKGNRFVVAPDWTPIANLWLTVADLYDARLDSFGESTGRISL